ncbi:nuclear transport factor 2 family protein [Actinomadura hibisca]|uniref:nuclear transport factor 2 family protein n=1 Tax=Actinomadura hibisca TaxID=68565 RepID=UPI00082DC6B5|nr:nuclear transport factor 2 family protein [Actinomadura hibisca]
MNHDTLLQHDQTFFQALMDADTARLQELLAEDFVLVGVEDGAVADKAALLTLITSGDLRFPAIGSFPDEAIVRRVGDVGVVVGRTSMTFDNPDGTTFSAGSRYTHVFATDASGTWRLLSAQGTTIKP